MKDLTINNINIGKLPSDWKDFTKKDIKALCKFLTPGICPDSLKVLLLLFVTKLKVLNAPSIPSPDKLPDKTLFAMKSKKTGVFYANNADLQALVDSFSFLFNEKDDKIYLESGIVINYFPYLRTKYGRKLYGPSSGLFNITFAEFIRLETLYENFRIGKTPDSEDRFCGTIYRKRDPKANPMSPEFSGDIRNPFNDHLAKKYTQNGSMLSPWKKIFIRLFYEGCRNFIIKKYENAFRSYEHSQEPGNTTFENYNRLVTGLSNGDLTKANLIRKAPLYDAFAQLEALVIEKRNYENALNKKPVY